ncbi:TrbC/VirB2 family protein [Paenibacillus sp. Y412MC10]|uniref:TrbC/VirB2 family protein n=1 Tax=Geobacillus sp. (strain Y412MC10) TaxID=481743 RepID=UPI0011AB6207|nr:TrbC/VirB2 family protein [Paenibacillus sp. Y412MC10]
MKNKVFGIMMFLFVFMAVAAPMSAFADTGTVNCSDAFGTSADDTIKTTLQSVIKIVGGVGGLLFTLAVMIIAIMIIFGSISAQKKGTYWTALISCFCGAFVFFGGYKFAGAIAKMAQGGASC